jgi:hypothetical protein
MTMRKKSKDKMLVTVPTSDNETDEDERAIPVHARVTDIETVHGTVTERGLAVSNEINI